MGKVALLLSLPWRQCLEKEPLIETLTGLAPGLALELALVPLAEDPLAAPRP